ncbi:MAG: hypothetical protein WD847_01855 [Pirellulales bacterium]
MRSQVRFFMDAADERAFIEAVVQEPSTVLVDGPDRDGRQAPLVAPFCLPVDAWYQLPQSARSEPDRSLWVGLGALQWLRGNADHKFKHDRHGAS